MIAYCPHPIPPAGDPCPMLANEDGITWLEDPARLPYVRETLVDVHFSRRRPGRAFVPGRRLVGFGTLRPRTRRDKQTGMFRRRIFWLASHDRACDPEGIYSRGCPSEAVDPATVRPGIPGRKTARARGGSSGPCPATARTSREELRR